MKIIVTGGLGHVGSKLIREIKADELVIIDNFTTQAYPSLYHLQTKYKLIVGDVLDLDLEPIFKGTDCVVHLAAIADPENSKRDSELVRRVNIRGSMLVAEACAKAGVPMIFASTTSVYGVQEEEVDETCDHLKPQTPYADSKIETEKMLGQVDGLRYVICRFGTVFGPTPGMRFHTAVNRFCFQAAIGYPITVWKTALNQNRPYLCMTDMVRGIEFIIKNQIFTNEIYNLVTVNTTVGHIVNIIKESIPDLLINYVDSEIMSQLSYTISSKKFLDLGFEFQGDIAKGIKDTLSLFQ